MGTRGRNPDVSATANTETAAWFLQDERRAFGLRFGGGTPVYVGVPSSSSTARSIESAASSPTRPQRPGTVPNTHSKAPTAGWPR